MRTELADAGQTPLVTTEDDTIKTSDLLEPTVVGVNVETSDLLEPTVVGVNVNDDASIDLTLERGERSADLNVSGDLRTWIIDGHKFTLPAKQQHVCSSADCAPCSGE